MTSFWIVFFQFDPCHEIHFIIFHLHCTIIIIIIGIRITKWLTAITNCEKEYLKITLNITT